MSKLFRQSLSNTSSKLSKHQKEMEVLRAHHQKVMSDKGLRQESLIGSGVFVRSDNGKLIVAKPYQAVIRTKQVA